MKKKGISVASTILTVLTFAVFMFIAFFYFYMLKEVFNYPKYSPEMVETMQKSNTLAIAVWTICYAVASGVSLLFSLPSVFLSVAGMRRSLKSCKSNLAVISCLYAVLVLSFILFVILIWFKGIVLI